MANDPASVTPAELIDAFVHPPTVVTIGHRAESSDGQVRIVSHVELWPWRVVVRGVRADRSLQERTGDVGESRRAEAMWFTTWRVSDDVGTEYRSAGGGGGGSGGATWSDFDVEFHPGVPLNAQQIIIETPEVDAITVNLHT